MYLKRVNPPKILADFIARSKNAGYLSAEVTDKHIKNINFLPMGELLHKNIQQEWNEIGTNFKSNINMHAEKDIQMELEVKNKIKFIEKYKALIKDKDPENIELFGIAETHRIKKDFIHGFVNDEESVKIELTAGGQELIGIYVVPDEQSMEYFYNIQRQRKLWWMQYASHPGRFSLSEVRDEKIRNLKVLTVWLVANYEFGKLPLESIQLIPGACFQTKYNTPKTEPILQNKIIKTSVPVDVATLETTIDAIDAGEFGEMAINRKLAPYQCAFYCFAKDDSVLTELKQMARLLQLIFEKSNIATFNLNECQFRNQTDLENMYLQNDGIGIPYIILLEANSLETGFLKLRNRDTTIHEIVHISRIEEYLVKIFNSYKNI